MAPITYTRAFRVRYYECDAYGHVNNANYLRYMQETAFDASAAAGLGMEAYARLGRIWLARATEIEYFQPLRYNDTFEVTTWVADMRRVSSRRMYEFRRGDELVAQAYTDWVFIDTETRRPATIPPEVIGAYLDPQESRPAAPRKHFPPTPPPPPGVFTTRRKVVWRDIDSAWIVNNPIYLEYVEEAGFEVVAAFGWPVERMTSEGFGILIRKHRIEYLSPARLGDLLEISTWASDVRRSSATRHYSLRQASTGEVVARVDSLGVWVDLASGRPIRIPASFMDSFAPNIAAETGAAQDGGAARNA